MTVINPGATCYHKTARKVSLPYLPKITAMMLLDFTNSLPMGSPLLLLVLIFMIWAVALVAIANGRFYDNTTKLCWFFLVLFLNVFGVLLFVFWGRKEVNYGKNPAA